MRQLLIENETFAYIETMFEKLNKQNLKNENTNDDYDDNNTRN